MSKHPAQSGHAPGAPDAQPAKPDRAAGIDVDEALARHLIGSQFPQVGLTTLECLGEGFDNVVWLAGGALAFRFPRRKAAVTGVRREMVVLPRLAALLPLPIPHPELLGEPDEAAGYPWPFYGGALVRGTPAGDLDLDDEARCALARPLGAFLRALHAAPVLEAVAGAGLAEDPFGRADMGIRARKTRMAFGDVQRLRLWSPNEWVIDLLEDARRLPPPVTSAAVHGDLHFRHLLVSGPEQGALSGVIDWGDLCLGAPAIDLQVYWSFLPPQARADFLEEYGGVPEEELKRARVIAYSLNSLLALYGHQTGNAAVLREAVGGLKRATRT